LEILGFPRVEHPCGFWGPPITVNHKAGGLKPGTRSYSQLEPQVSLLPLAKGAHPPWQQLALREPAISSRNTIALFPALKPYPEAD